MIEENIGLVREKIQAIYNKLRRPPEEMCIVAVSKGRSSEQIKEAIKAGITDIGENRVQEAIIKYNSLRPNTQDQKPIKWHMVGHLQTNKVKEAVKIFDLIQSVDSPHLATEINRQATKISKVQDILIEVKTSPEATKFGLKPDEVIEIIKEISQLKNINIKGLMTIAPIVDNPGKTRPCFTMLRDLRDEVNKFGIWKSGFGILSMGMSDDFEVAIEEGSNMVRLGRAIFEA